MSDRKYRAELYVKEWRERVQRGVQSRETAQKMWDRYVKFYQNKMWEGVDEKIRDDLATVNLVYPLVSIILETTYNQNPHIYVRPTRPEFALAAEVLEFLVNHLWYDLKIDRQVRRCIKNATLQAIGPIELGFSGTFESGSIKPHDMPYVKALLPKEFVTDPTCTTFDDEQSLFRGVQRSVSFRQFEEMYPKAAKELKPKYKDKLGKIKDTPPVDEKLWPEGVPPWSRVEYWQVQDLLTNRFYFIHDDLDEFVDVVDNPYSVEGFLSEVLTFNEIPDELWPMSDVQPIEFQQKELNKMRTYMMRHWKKNFPFYIADENVWSEEDLNKLVNADDLEFVLVSDPSEGALRVIQPQSAGTDFYQHHAEIKGDYREISGISEYYRGGTVPGTKTAFETRQVQEGTAVRLQGHARAVTDFVESIARKLIQIVKDYYTLPIVAQIAGEKGQLYWRKFSRMEIQSEVDVRVFLGSTMPPDAETDKLQASQFYQQFRQDPILNQRKVVFETLKMWGKPDPQSYFLEANEQGPDPFTPNDRGGGADRGSQTAQGNLRMNR